jgi:hypothetical protein
MVYICAIYVLQVFGQIFYIKDKSGAFFRFGFVIKIETVKCSLVGEQWI